MLRIKAHDVFEQNEFRAFSLISKVFKKKKPVWLQEENIQWQGNN